MTNNPNPIFQNQRVLVVDDIKKWIKVAKDNLTYYGCPLENIIAAEDVENGFTKYLEQHPTFSMVDINFNKHNLEDVQGLDLIRKLRKNDHESLIMAMSSLVGNIEERTKQAGANYFIDKQDFVGGFDNFVKWYSER
ncbi:MAG: response regulator [archaeon]